MQGAQLLLTLNRNQVLFQNIMRTPKRPQWKAKLEYELNKYLKIRLDNMTRTEVAQMDMRVTAEAEEIVKKAIAEPTSVTEDTPDDRVPLKGRRQDHDKLPTDVQFLFSSCGGIYKKIRKLHTLLRSMKNAPSCDRYEYLKQMDELDDLYRKRMKEYDEYVATPEGTSPTTETSTDETEEKNETPADETAENGDSNEQTGYSNPVSVARTWLNRNIKRLEKMAAEKESDETVAVKYDDLVFEFRPRIDAILSNGGTIGEKVRSKLRELGVKLPDENE